MPRPAKAQRNPYRGEPARACVQLAVHPLQGAPRDLVFLVDTGCPCPLIVAEEVWRDCLLEEAGDVMTNFGLLKGGWSQVTVGVVDINLRVKTYGSDAVAAAVRQSVPEFAGLAGLPLLRMFEYGGDSSEFWLQSARRPKKRK